MGTVKDIIDLLVELQSKVNDRETAAVILTVQQLVSTLQSENADLLEKYTQAKKENVDLISNNFELQKKIHELESPGVFSGGVHIRGKE